MTPDVESHQPNNTAANRVSSLFLESPLYVAESTRNYPCQISIACKMWPDFIMPIWFCFLGKSWPKHEYVFVERKACVRFDRDLPKIGQASKCKSVRITRTAAIIIIVIDVKWLHRFSVLWACARYLEQGGHLHILKLLFAYFNLKFVLVHKSLQVGLLIFQYMLKKAVTQ